MISKTKKNIKRKKNQDVIILTFVKSISAVIKLEPEYDYNKDYKNYIKEKNKYTSY